MLKKKFYIFCTIILTTILSFLLHAVIEFYYIRCALIGGIALDNTKFLGSLYCVLPWWISYSLLLGGFVGGYFLGQAWWRIVYVEKRHWRMKNK